MTTPIDTAMYEAVKRARVEAMPLPLSLDHVADTSHGGDQLLDVSGVDLLAQMIDHDVDDVRARVEVVPPRVFRDQRAAHDTAGMAHEILEHRVLLGRHLDCFAGALHLARRLIQR